MDGGAGGGEGGDAKEAVGVFVLLERRGLVMRFFGFDLGGGRVFGGLFWGVQRIKMESGAHNSLFFR